MAGGHCRPPPPFSPTRFSPRRFCNRTDPPRAALNENHAFQSSALTVFRSRGISSFSVAAQGTAPICLSSEPRAGGEAAAPVVKAEMAAGARVGAVPQQLELHSWMRGVHIWMGRGRPGGPIPLLVLVMGGTEGDVPQPLAAPRQELDGGRSAKQRRIPPLSLCLLCEDRRGAGLCRAREGGEWRGGGSCWSGSQDAERCAIGKCTGGDGFPQKGAAGTPPLHTHTSPWVAASAPEPALIRCPLTPGLPPAGEGARLSPVPFICRRQSPTRGWGLLSRFVLRVMNVRPTGGCGPSPSAFVMHLGSPGALQVAPLMLSGGSGALSLGCLGSCPCYGAGGQAAGWAVCSPTARISPLTSRWGSSRNARRSLLPTKGFSGALQPFRRARGGHGAGVAQGAQRGTAGSSTELSTAVPFPSRGAARGPQAPSSPYPRLGRGDTAVHTALPGAAGDCGTHNWASRAVPQCRRLQEMTDAGCCHLPKRCHPQNRTPPPPPHPSPHRTLPPLALFSSFYIGGPMG